MKEKRLLYAIGWVDDRFIAEMQERTAKPRASKRFWLLAAVIAALLILAGCAAVILHLQKVGKYQVFYVPTVYDENGEVIPTEYQEPMVYYAIEGANQEAVAQWLAFIKTYDLDGQAMLEADRAQHNGTFTIPENLYSIYGCYSQEMVDKLTEITKESHLKLLKTDIFSQEYETADAYLTLLGVKSLLNPDAGAEVKYPHIRFTPDGAFLDSAMELTIQWEGWSLKNTFLSFTYSRKDYFLPWADGFLESENPVQWEYTRWDGKRVLLVKSADSASIYASSRDANITISLESAYQVNGEPVPLKDADLEKLAELFDLSIHPNPATMAEIQAVQAQALLAYQAQKEADAARRAQEQADWEAHYHCENYQTFVQARIEKEPRPEVVSYLLQDLNGDGAEELVIQGREILSMKHGETFLYYNFSDPAQNPILAGKFTPCENGVFKISGTLWEQYHFYQAGTDAPIFLTGVLFDEQTNTWYQSLNGDFDAEDRIPITPEEAQRILAAYPTVEADWLPLTRYGDPQMPPKFQDPYAQYIANQMYRYPEAKDFHYALLDIDGNGVKELITVETHSWESESAAPLLIQTLKDGKLLAISDLDDEKHSYAERYSAVCEGGILENRDQEGTFFEFSRLTPEGVIRIEKVVQDPITLYWGHVPSGGEGRTVRKEAAMAVIDSYQHMELDFHPFSEYPFS